MYTIVETTNVDKIVIAPSGEVFALVDGKHTPAEAAAAVNSAITAMTFTLTTQKKVQAQITGQQATITVPVPKVVSPILTEQELRTITAWFRSVHAPDTEDFRLRQALMNLLNE